ncbi:MAG: hypothetical protein SVP26_09525 [Chloroflexota bacterium]|nr:hypothetical protein [Chloroflexota bacterium]
MPASFERHAAGTFAARPVCSGKPLRDVMTHTLPVRHRLARFVALLLTFVFLAAVSGCSQSQTSAILHEEASAYGFSIVGWHAANVPFKLLQLPFTLGELPSLDEEAELVDRFFAAGAELAHIERDLQRELSLHGSGTAYAQELEAELERVREEHSSLAPKVEALIQHEVAAALASEDLGLEFAGCTLAFPPVVFVFQSPPKLLVLSPRDRVERLDDMLLSPDIGAEDIEAVEDAILEDHGLSALVVTPGGVATYPSIVNERVDLYNSVLLAAHEWTHQYLFFHPLGLTYFRGGVMQEMNEAVADIVGREVALIVCPPDAEPPAGDEPAFDFVTEMQQTRAHLDLLLQEGSVEAAEDYLEQRRQLFVDNGYYIRKLNQAYFAFYGTYASSPASVSPVAEQLDELRDYYPTLGEFVRAVQGLTSHEELLALLVEKRSQH